MGETSKAMMRGMAPYLTIGGGRGGEAIDFYKAAFGAEEVARMPAENSNKIMHAHLTINGSPLLLSDDFPEHLGGKETAAPSAVTMHIQCDDADRWFKRATDAGATVAMPLDNMFWGDRYGQLKDPFGHSWSIGAPQKA
jgi:PhnB protein